MVNTGGTNGLIDRLLSLVEWRFTSTTSDQERIDCLNALNICEQLIAQSESLMYLSTDVVLPLLNNFTSVAVPASPVIAFGKEIVLRDATDTGVIEYLPPDKFAAMRNDSVYLAGMLHPVFFTIVWDHAASERQFKFKPGNTSGVTYSMTLTAQRVPPALVDSTSASILPEGFELTLLLPMAEQYLKSKRNEFGLETLSASLQSQLAEFYNQQRSNKEKALTDRGKTMRKQDVTVANERY